MLTGRNVRLQYERNTGVCAGQYKEFLVNCHYNQLLHSQEQELRPCHCQDLTHLSPDTTRPAPQRKWAATEQAAGLSPTFNLKP